MAKRNGADGHEARAKRARETGSRDVLQRGMEGARAAVHRAATKVEQLTAPPEGTARPSDSGQRRLARWADFKTMIFDDDREFARFTDYVYKHFAGRGLMLTNVPIPQTARLSPWLFQQTSGQFAMREVKQHDIDRARQRFQGRSPFDPATIDDFFDPLAELDPALS